MARFEIRRHSTILRGMLARFIARTSGVVDLSDASATKRVLATAAREVDRSYYDASLIRDEFDLERCAGDALDERAKELDGIEDEDSTRQGAAPAFGGAVVFWRVGTTGTVAIPAGTIVKTAAGREFATVAQAQIDEGGTALIAGHAAGQDSAPVSVVAREAGSAGNVGIGAIRALGSRPAGVDGVENLATTEYGRDREADPDFRARLRAAIARIGKCSRRSLLAAAHRVKLASGQRVVSARLLDNFDDLGRTAVYIEDGAGTAESTAQVTDEVVTAGLLGPPINRAVGGEELLRLDFWPLKPEAGISFESSERNALTVGRHVHVSPTDGWLRFTPPLQPGEQIKATYRRFTGLIQEVQRVLDGDDDNGDLQNYPGFDAAGHQARVLAPTVRWQRYEALLLMLEGFDREVAIVEAKDRVARYYNTRTIGADVIANALIDVVMEVPGVGDMIQSWPPANRPIGDAEVARILATAIAIR